MPSLLNLERVAKSYGVRPLLTDASLGIGAGERIGMVGRNGDGRTTLLEVMTGLEEPVSGRVSRQRGLLVGYLHQGARLEDSHRVREAVLGGRSDHEWAADPRTRGVVAVLLAGVVLDRAVLGLSGGEWRRCHLDVGAVARLAQHLAGWPSALVVVTHDRWFLDAVCQWPWEVHDGVVDAYEGWYAAFVLARAERQRFAAQRLGEDVIDVEDVDLVCGDRQLLSHATWRLDPDGRVLATVESFRRVIRTADGEITASSMLERFGFTGDRLTARIGDLSGGERRRFQLLRLLFTEPNVLLLDEPNTQEPYVVRTPSFSRSEGRSRTACRTRAAHRVARLRHPGRTSRKVGAW